MNKEEFIGKLQMVYVGDKRASKEIISEYDRLKDIINQKESMYDNLAVDYRLEQEKTDRLKGALQTHEILLKTTYEEKNRLNNIINELEEYIIEEIDDAQEELNIILQGNNLDYKNECTKEFNCIKNALDMLLDKLQELKENNNE